MVGAHLSQALVTLHGEFLFPLLQDGFEQLLGAGVLNVGPVYIDHKGRLVQLDDIFGERPQAPVLRQGGEIPVDFIRPGAVAEDQLMQAVLLVEFHAGADAGRLDLFGQPLELLRRAEVRLFLQVRFGQQLHHLAVAQALLQLFKERKIFRQIAEEFGERAPLQALALAVGDEQVLGGAAHHLARKLLLIPDVFLRLALLQTVERRLRNVDMSPLNELLHLPEKEGQQQRADVRSIHVGVGHEDDLAVAELGDIEVVLADAGADGGNHVANLFVAQHLVVTGLFHIQNLPLERQNRLIAPVAALLGGAAGRLSLHQEQLTAGRVLLLTIGQLAGQGAGVERALAARQLPRFPRRLPCAGRFNRLLNNPPRDRGRALKSLA